MNKKEREWAEARIIHLAQQRSHTLAELKESADLLRQLNEDDTTKAWNRQIHGGSHSGTWKDRNGVRFNDANTDYNNPNLVLRSGDSYAKWLLAQEGQRYGHDGF